MDLLDLKKRLVNCIRIMVGEGLFELTYGHMSCRIPDSEDFLVLGHLHDRGKHIAEITVEDIVTMDADGNTPAGEIDAPGERFIHTAVYARRADVNAVVHCHPMMSTCFSIAGVEILPVNHLGLIFSPSVRIHEYSGQIDTADKASKMAQTLGERTAVLLRAHGVVVTGSDLEKACLSALALEHTAKMHALAAQLGAARPVRGGVSTEGRFSEGIDETEYFGTAWAHYSWKYRERLYGEGMENGASDVLWGSRQRS
jgi:L-ribulose-5-phosphate 4-epimerase